MLQDRLVDVPNAITRIWAEQGIYSFAPSPDDVVAGAIILILAMVAIPVAVLMTGAAASAILGESLRRDGIVRNEGSELLELED